MIETLVDSFDIWGTAQTQKSLGKKAGIDNISLHGINRLRELILELAVRGKLVEQNPEDEPAKVLLKKILKEKHRLIEEKIIRKQNSLPKINSENVPHKIPNTWLWVYLSEIGQIVGGGTPSSNESNYWSENEICWLTPADLYDIKSKYISKGKRFISLDGLNNSSAFIMPKGSVLFSSRAPIGYVAITSNELCTNQGFKSIVPYVDGMSEYIYFFLKHAASEIDRNASGTTFKEISGAGMSKVLFSLPPLKEQHRIVAKVDELMALCDMLEQQQMNHIETHLKLVEALLQTLTDATTTKELKAAWQHLEPHFDILFTTEESIELLKQTILQLAMMGKLVPQDPNEEPASELLKKIEAEKNKLFKEGKLKKQKPLPEITEDEKPFELPEGWEWKKFGVFSEFINGDRSKNYPNKSEYVNEGIAWINTGHIEPIGKLTTTDMNFITREKFDSLRSGKIERDDLVYCLRGATFGKTAFVEPYEEGAIASSLMIIRPILKEMKHFIFLYLKSPFAKEQLFRFDNGSAQPNLSANSVLQYFFPLPPLSEQQRIVEKVNELMSLCDQLKERIITTKELKVKLADAVVERAVKDKPEKAYKITDNLNMAADPEIFHKISK